MTGRFVADTADAIWRDAAKALVEDSDVLSQDSRIGPTRELLHCMFVLNKPRQRWVLSRRPALNPAFAIAETVWILQGRNDAAFVNFWNPKLPEFAGKGDTYHGAYGYRLRHNLGFDQLERGYQALLNNPDSRQVVMQIWDGRIDFPHASGKPRDPDIPCNIVSMPKIRDDRLEWMQVMRSNDLFLGTPHNFIQFTVLQEVMAGWLGIELGAYVQLSDSLHFYEKDMARISVTPTASTAENTETLALPKDDFDRMLPRIGDAMDRLRAPGLSRQDFLSVLRTTDLPRGWRMVFAVAAADAARRRDWHAEMEEAAALCTNPMLSEAWANWLDRVSGAPQSA